MPTQRPDRPQPGEKFHEWEGNFYDKYSHESFTGIIRPGSAIVIDDVEGKDIGSIDSYKEARRQLYQKVGLPADRTVEEN
ncbi:MAG: hypothetical protein M1339_05780 [Bacteroidetes bacterium]|nr:hypothetical protein [Bacteroidota bacterium]